MIIRPEMADDVPAIRAVTAAAFKGMLYSSGTEATIVDALRDAGVLTLSLVAEKQAQWTMSGGRGSRCAGTGTSAT